MTPLFASFVLDPEDRESRFAYLHQSQNKFVAEWRNVLATLKNSQDEENTFKVSFQVSLLPNGDIVFAYRNVEQAMQYIKGTSLNV